MKKYSSGSFIDAAVRIYGSEADTLTSFPASIIANGGNITPWTVYGNTVEGESVGEKTDNMFDKSILIDGKTISVSGEITDYIRRTTTGTPIDVSEIDNVTLSYTATLSRTRWIYALFDDDAMIAREAGVFSGTSIDVSSGNKLLICFYDPTDAEAVTANDLSNIMLNKGTTIQPFVPYGYNVPIICNNIAYNCYISDVLRKSSGANPVYDIMSSTGVITRNVDTDGTPLVTPTTESFTAPTLATVAGSQSVSFDTTVKPSKAELTYTGWHTHSDKKRSGGAWT